MHAGCDLTISRPMSSQVQHRILLAREGFATTEMEAVSCVTLDSPDDDAFDLPFGFPDRLPDVEGGESAVDESNEATDSTFLPDRPALRGERYANSGNRDFSGDGGAR